MQSIKTLSGTNKKQYTNDLRATRRTPSGHRSVQFLVQRR
ncbi:Uncharacterized protein APZ42_023115 [Daphnia magna]|uniref:Uncharacterized protein n=1 Tax=Daphnia magna TaxID=35525 RepID=A0A164V6Y9_9CRUS|nr:Uncharacterized protein APZ42_023115 [Daphnia magna]